MVKVVPVLSNDDTTRVREGDFIQRELGEWLEEVGAKVRYKYKSSPDPFYTHN